MKSVSSKLCELERRQFSNEESVKEMLKDENFQSYLSSSNNQNPLHSSNQWAVWESFKQVQAQNKDTLKATSNYFNEIQENLQNIFSAGALTGSGGFNEKNFA